MTTTMTTATAPAHASGRLRIGDEFTVNRFGFGTMQLTGPGTWGPPADRDEAIRVLRHAVDAGVDLIDTADSYGPHVAEDLVREALHPYPEGLHLATKGGLVRRGPAARDEPWPAIGRPEYLRHCVEMSLRRLAVDTIDLYQLHRIDPAVPLVDSLGELDLLRQEGKIRAIGVSEVSLSTLEEARRIAPIASVQNQYNLARRAHQDVLDRCTEQGLAFIPWEPLDSGELLRADHPLARIAAETGLPAPALAVAWLLDRSPVMLPIPGTSSTAHLVDDLAACGVELDDELRARLDALVG